MLFQCYPSPYHEFYFEEIAEIWQAGGTIDQEAVERMRRRYDVHQLTPLRYEPPPANPRPNPRLRPRPNPRRLRLCPHPRPQLPL